MLFYSVFSIITFILFTGCLILEIIFNNYNIQVILTIFAIIFFGFFMYFFCNVLYLQYTIIYAVG